MRIAIMAVAGLPMMALAGCSNESAPAAAPAVETAKSLAAGQYEVSTKVEDLRSTDHTTPLTKAKLATASSSPVVHRACVAEDGSIAADMFAEAGDKCKTENSYVRGGKINLQLSCTRSGAAGQVLQSIAGEYTADSFTATVNTGTYFAGAGDYAMRRTMTAKRVGSCPSQEKAG
ncbi:MAG TPA: DUF3617 family protein [Sphingomicrobium sp.]